MTGVLQVRAAAPRASSSAAAPFRPDYERAAELALAYARPLAVGAMSDGEVEDRLLRCLAGPDYEREEAARRKAASFIRLAAIVLAAPR